ncbi:MAG: ABC transporter ATP-binding protein [Clostridia bacterium]|nr:ABC transporter ATP-binding protein [Clostridia bacterium]
MIEFCNVSFQYQYADLPLLTNLSFCLQNGTNTVLCDYQSGKTTIAKLLMGQISPTSGAILWNGQPLEQMGLAERGILYLPKQPVFFNGKSVFFNLAYPLRVRKTPKKQIEQIVMKVANQLGIENLLKTKVGKLTGQQKLQVALARGLTVQRQVVVLDGFLEQLDQQQKQQVFSLLQYIPTCIILTDDTSLAQGTTVVLDGGACVFQGDATTAQSVVENLYWLANKTRSN